MITLMHMSLETIANKTTPLNQILLHIYLLQSLVELTDTLLIDKNPVKKHYCIRRPQMYVTTV